MLIIIINLGIESVDFQQTRYMTEFSTGRSFISLGLDGLASVSELALSFLQSPFPQNFGLAGWECSLSPQRDTIGIYLTVHSLYREPPLWPGLFFVTSTWHAWNFMMFQTSVITA